MTTFFAEFPCRRGYSPTIRTMKFHRACTLYAKLGIIRVFMLAFRAFHFLDSRIVFLNWNQEGVALLKTQKPPERCENPLEAGYEYPLITLSHGFALRAKGCD